jgi:hypothetical protein
MGLFSTTLMFLLFGLREREWVPGIPAILVYGR